MNTDQFNIPVSTFRCIRCNTEYLNNYKNLLDKNVCMFCKRTESEEKVKAILRKDAQTHIGRMFK